MSYSPIEKASEYQTRRLLLFEGILMANCNYFSYACAAACVLLP